MNTYRTSYGERVTKIQIDKLVHGAKAAKIELMQTMFGYIFCEECKRNKNCGEPIDCSHDISVDRCQKNGTSELAWDIKNITMRCRTCHRKHDKN